MIYSVFFKLSMSIILDEAIILTEVFTYSAHTVATTMDRKCIWYWQIRYIHKTMVHNGPYTVPDAQHTPRMI